VDAGWDEDVDVDGRRQPLEGRLRFLVSLLGRWPVPGNSPPATENATRKVRAKAAQDDDSL